MNAKEVIELVKDGNYPSEWNVFPGNYTDIDGFVWILIAIAFIGVAVIIPLALLNNHLDISSIFVSIIIILCFGGASLLIFRYLFRREPASSKQPLLVILPDGIVQFQPEDYRKYYSFNFSKINSISLANQTTVQVSDGIITTRNYYWLDVFYSNGTYLKCDINPAFGDPIFIGNTIIAAYRHYWQI